MNEWNKYLLIVVANMLYGEILPHFWTGELLLPDSLAAPSGVSACSKMGGGFPVSCLLWSLCFSYKMFLWPFYILSSHLKASQDKNIRTAGSFLSRLFISAHIQLSSLAKMQIYMFVLLLNDIHRKREMDGDHKACSSVRLFRKAQTGSPLSDGLLGVQMNITFRLNILPHTLRFALRLHTLCCVVLCPI